MRINPVLIYILVMAGVSIFNKLKKSLDDQGDSQPMSYDDDFPVSEEELDLPKMAQSEMKPRAEKHYTSYDDDLFEDDLSSVEEPMVSVNQTQEQVRSMAQVQPAKSPTPPPRKRGSLSHLEGSERRARKLRDSKQGNRSVLKPELTPENLMQGIIMAEILQPPRAKRPYRPVYMERED